jgi:hypothetical protein
MHPASHRKVLHLHSNCTTAGATASTTPTTTTTTTTITNITDIVHNNNKMSRVFSQYLLTYGYFPRDVLTYNKYKNKLLII